MIGAHQNLTQLKTHGFYIQKNIMPSVFLIYTSYWLVVMIKLNHIYNMQQEDCNIIGV